MPKKVFGQKYIFERANRVVCSVTSNPHTYVVVAMQFYHAKKDEEEDTELLLLYSVQNAALATERWAKSVIDLRQLAQAATAHADADADADSDGKNVHDLSWLRAVFPDGTLHTGKTSAEMFALVVAGLNKGAAFVIVTPGEMPCTAVPGTPPVRLFPGKKLTTEAMLLPPKEWSAATQAFHVPFV